MHTYSAHGSIQYIIHFTDCLYSHPCVRLHLAIRDFTEYITKLLKRLLTYDPERRMNFNDFFTSAMECVQRVDVLDVWTGKTHKLKAEDHGR